MQEKLGVQLKTLVEQGDIEAALQLLAAVETWPQKALNDALYELAWRAALPWTDAHLTLATALLDAGANASATPYRYGGTPLHYAAKTYNLVFVTLLLARGAEVNAVTEKRETPLHAALYWCDKTGEQLPVVRALLEAGADPNINAYGQKPRRDRDTSLMLAIKHRELETAKLLVAHGADLNQRGEGRLTAICAATKVAAEDGDLTFLEWLLELGVDLNDTKYHFDDTPLTIAAEWNRLTLIDYLVQAGADVTKGHPLVAAASRGHLEAAERLLELDANVDGVTCPPQAGELSPLHLAVKQDNRPLTRLLLEHGYDPNHGANADGVDGHTPLHLAAEYARPATINTLLRHGADIEAQTAYRHTPLYFAAAASRLTAVRVLLKAGARASVRHVDVLLSVRRVGIISFTHVTPQDFNQRFSYNKIVALLIEHLDDSKERTRSEKRYREHLEMRLRWAITGRDKRQTALKSVLEWGADPNTTFEKRRTPLHYAAECGNLAAIQLLLDRGVKVNVSTSFGYTPLHYAVRCKNSQLVELLLAAGADPGAQIGGGSRLAGWTPLHFAHSYQKETVIRLLTPVSPPLAEPVEPGSHSLAGTYIDAGSHYSTPFKVTGPSHRERCHICGEYALYRVGAVWDGTNLLHADCTNYLRCGNCNAKLIQENGYLRPYKGKMRRWRKLKRKRKE